MTTTIPKVEQLLAQALEQDAIAGQARTMWRRGEALALRDFYLKQAEELEAFVVERTTPKQGSNR